MRILSTDSYLMNYSMIYTDTLPTLLIGWLLNIRGFFICCPLHLPYHIYSHSIIICIYLKGGGYPTPNSPSELLTYCTKSTTSNSYVCSICGQFSHARRYLVRNHVESKHFPEAFEYHCEFCDKICKTKKGLEVHIFEKHKNYNYSAAV